MNLRRVRCLIVGAGAATLWIACARNGGTAGGTGVTAATTPAAAVGELLAADKGFSAASERTDVVAGLTPMLAEDVVMAVPGGRFAEGKAAVVQALRSHPDAARSRIGWTPVRGGISADGLHGFTYGYMTLHEPDDSVTALKYLSYWVKGPEGWRVVAYNRRRRPVVDVSLAPMPPVLPARMVRPSGDSAATEEFRVSLDEAERSFSRDAQRSGLRAAFVRYGGADAINMGPRNRADFVMGADSIADMVSVDEPATGSSVSWGPDRVIVASSGDLGVTIGTILVNEPDSTGTRARFPFFTVWRRAGPSEPWRYVAE